MCLVAGIKFRVEGLDKRVSSGPDYTPHVTMFAHPSNLDPIVLLATSPVTHKVAGKQVCVVTCLDVYTSARVFLNDWPRSSSHVVVGALPMRFDG